MQKITFLTAAFLVFFLNTTAQTTIAQANYDGVYQFEWFTMTKPVLKDVQVSGIFTIKDGYIDMVTKTSNLQFKITNINKGVIYLENKGMVYTLKIMPEIGTIKNTTYDTKIVFSDTAMKTEGEYWCIKK